jgi:nitroreductase
MNAMDAMTAILTRRSVRQYIDKPVPEGVIQEILKAATSAPSAGNQQPWHFIVITDRVVLDQIPNVHPYSGMLKQASLAILTCGSLELEKHEGFWVQDCSAATQNILLAARALGLGAVWLGVYPRTERVIGLRRLLGIPDNVIPLSLASIGYSDVQQASVDRYKSDRIHRDSW